MCTNYPSILQSMAKLAYYQLAHPKFCKSCFQGSFCLIRRGWAPLGSTVIHTMVSPLTLYVSVPNKMCPSAVKFTNRINLYGSSKSNCSENLVVKLLTYWLLIIAGLMGEGEAQFEFCSCFLNCYRSNWNTTNSLHFQVEVRLNAQITSLKTLKFAHKR